MSHEYKIEVMLIVRARTDEVDYESGEAHATINRLCLSRASCGVVAQAILDSTEHAIITIDCSQQPVVSVEPSDQAEFHAKCMTQQQIPTETPDSAAEVDAESEPQQEPPPETLPAFVIALDEAITAQKAARTSADPGPKATPYEL